ncbi:hypothetical protein ABT336_09700 [Micromonospora sp. NPDC000207]|uniref:hypothetical protein n=1 Tax=Micromonospora sp. NPDC000207 TaxID=3154246 RepID=UPI003331C6E8
MRVETGRAAVAVATLVLLPGALFGCALGGDDPDARPSPTPSEDVDAKSRERVQAYLDAMVAKDVAAGRNQLCTPLYDAFDAGATGPNGDFADHFEVSDVAITDVRRGPRGQQVDTVLTVTVGTRQVVRALEFTVTRSGADWCISGEAPGTPSPQASETPATASPQASDAPAAPPKTAGPTVGTAADDPDLNDAPG